MGGLDIDACIDRLWNQHEFLSEKDLKTVCQRVKEARPQGTGPFLDDMLTYRLPFQLSSRIGYGTNQ